MNLHALLFLVCLAWTASSLWLVLASRHWRAEWLDVSERYARALDREAGLREALRGLGIEFERDGSIRGDSYASLQRLRQDPAARLVPPQWGQEWPGAAIEPLPRVPPVGGFGTSGPPPNAPVQDPWLWYCQHGCATEPCPVCFPSEKVVDSPRRTLSYLRLSPVAAGVPYRPPARDRERRGARGGEPPVDAPEV